MVRVWYSCTCWARAGGDQDGWRRGALAEGHFDVPMGRGIGRKVQLEVLGSEELDRLGNEHGRQGEVWGGLGMDKAGSILFGLGHCRGWSR